MKKTLFAVLIIFAFILIFTACDTPEPPEESANEASNMSETESLPESSTPEESTPDDSLPEESIPDTSAPETSKPETSEPETSKPETSEPEVSEPETSEPESYTAEELHSLFIELKKEEESGDRELSLDNIHIGAYFTVDGHLIDYVGKENFDKAVEMFGVVGINHGIVSYYFGITKQEYTTLYQQVLDTILPDYPAALYMGIFCYQYEIWFSDEYWSYPELFYSDYIPSETKSHYTPINEDRQYIRAYYNIDYKLIEHVGIERFNNWLDKTDEANQNIVVFVKDFGITKDTFTSIYKDIKTLPYNPNYLFGTAEMQEEYFKVHPLNKE